MLEREDQLDVFKYKEFFEATNDNVPKEKIPYVLLNSRGMQLIDDYYADKYEIPHFKNFKSFEDLADYITSPEFKQTVKDLDDIRIPFVVTTILNGVDGPFPHSTPVVFVKENGKQGIVSIDSIALSPSTLADQISKKISVFTAKDWEEARPEKNYSSQRDFYSCHAGAMVNFKKLVGKVNGRYLMPNLLDSLMQNAKQIGRNLYAAILPSPLLITVQDKKFFSIQKPEMNAVVHKHADKNETLAEFLARYPEAADYGKESKQPVSSYVRIKGLKYANIIEIQFYINQLKQRLGADFTSELRKKFILEAKQIFKEQGELTSKSIKRRQGIYQLAEFYLANAAKMNMEAKVKEQEKVQPLQESHLNVNSSPPIATTIQTQENSITSEMSNSTRLINELNESLKAKDWPNAVQVLLAMTPDNLKDPKIDQVIQQTNVQDEIRKEYQLFLDKIKRVDRNQRSAIIKNVLEKKNALGAILCPGKESPFFGAKEIKQKPIRVVKVGPSVQKKF